MPDKKYDAVIVGGGHHATIIACYLQRGGLKTAMFERWHEMGHASFLRAQDHSLEKTTARYEGLYQTKG